MNANLENLAPVIYTEVARASRLHPGEFDYQTWLLVLTEEVGELAQTLLEEKPLAYQVEEATHVAAVAVRIAHSRGYVNIVNDLLQDVFSGKKPTKGSERASFREVLYHTGQLSNYSTWAAADATLRKIIFHAVTLLSRLMPDDGSVPEVDRVQVAGRATRELQGEELIDHLDFVSKLRNRVAALESQIAERDAKVPVPWWFVTVSSSSSSNRLQELVTPLAYVFDHTLCDSPQALADTLTALVVECNARFPRCRPLKINTKSTTNDSKGNWKVEVVSMIGDAGASNLYEHPLITLSLTKVKTHVIPTDGLNSMIRAVVETGAYVKKDSEFTRAAQGLGFGIKDDNPHAYHVHLQPAQAEDDDTIAAKALIEIEMAKELLGVDDEEGGVAA